MEAQQLTTSQRVVGAIGLLAGSLIVAGGGYLFGLLMLAFSSDGCGSGDGLDIVFILWTGVCVIGVLVPPAVFLWKSQWKPALLSVLGVIGLMILGFVAAFVVLLQVCN